MADSPCVICGRGLDPGADFILVTCGSEHTSALHKRCFERASEKAASTQRKELGRIRRGVEVYTSVVVAWYTGPLIFSHCRTRGL